MKNTWHAVIGPEGQEIGIAGLIRFVFREVIQTKEGGPLLTGVKVWMKLERKENTPSFNFKMEPVMDCLHLSTTRAPPPIDCLACHGSEFLPV